MAKKSKNYITKEDQDMMIKLIDEFLIETNDGEIKTHKSDMIMNKLYSKYIDKIIIGIINAYRFWRFNELEDLQSVARMKVYESIIKKQFDPERGSIFTFFCSVVSNNLYSFTMRENKKREHINDFIELETIFTLEAPIYFEDFDKNFIIDHIFDELQDFFKEKPRFQKLADVFRIYFKNNIGRKFVKKDFIEFARTYTFSDSFCSSFFDACKKVKNVSKLIEEVIGESQYGGGSGILISTSKNNRRSYNFNEENI